MTANLRFNYLHRDSGNYKTFGYVDFSNSNKLSLEDAKRLIRAHLIDSEFFYPQKVGIPLSPFTVTVTMSHGTRWKVWRK